MSSIWVDLLGAEVKFYDTPEGPTRSIEAGKGEPLIFLHGSGGHAEAFSRNVVPLSDQFRVCAIDMIGHGLSPKPDCNYDAPDYAQHLVNFMDAAGMQRASIAGESLGGFVACWTALYHPDRVNKVISITGAGMDVETDPESAEYQKQGVGELQRLSRQFAANPTRENLRARLGWLFHDASDITEELVDVRWALYNQPGGTGALARLGAGSGPTNPNYQLTVERLREIKALLLFLWTEFNPSTPAPTARRAQAQIPGSQYVELRDCAHWPQWEDPEAFNNAVRSFLNAR
jgi:2-hydroxy-6-oxonona-2,4-dienedioate hydrolase/2-hydroxy-6-oxo-6-(2'-carboxyphenyl)-hexa-2,4-dienoate hydrolase